MTDRRTIRVPEQAERIPFRIDGTFDPNRDLILREITPGRLDYSIKDIPDKWGIDIPNQPLSYVGGTGDFGYYHRHGTEKVYLESGPKGDHTIVPCDCCKRAIVANWG